MTHVQVGPIRAIPGWIQRLSTFLTQRNEYSAVTAIEQAVIQFQEMRFSLALLGKAKRGKSTLVNALLGRADDLLAPVDRLPASSAITHFHWAEKESAQVVFRDGRQQLISYEMIKDYVTEEFNRENQKQVDVVHVWGPFQGLDPSTELIDTPGAGSIHEYHDVLLNAFIPTADAVLFLMTARMPLDQDDLDLLKQIRTADIRKIFFVMNRVDEVIQTDLTNALQHNRELLSRCGISVGEIHCISAKQAFLGNLPGSGLPELLHEINAFLAANKRKILLERLISRVRQIAAPIRQCLQLQQITARKSATDIDIELRDLEVQKDSLEQDRELVSQEFSLAWRRAIDEFQLALQSSQTRVTSDLKGYFEKTFESPSSQQLSAVLNELLDRHAKPVADAVEFKLRQASDKLQASYPELQFTPEGVPIFMSQLDSTVLLTASAGGVAVAGTGLGLVAAGTVTAASISAANAAALAATTTVAVPTAMGGVLSSVPYIGAILNGLATGTATVSTPLALTATPLWVALSGPIGWSLAGVGVLAIPLAWRSSRLKAKAQLREETLRQVDEIFSQLREHRLPLMRQMSASIIEEFQLRLDYQIREVKRILNTQARNRPTATEIAAIEQANRALDQILAEID